MISSRTLAVAVAVTAFRPLQHPNKHPDRLSEETYRHRNARKFALEPIQLLKRRAEIMSPFFRTVPRQLPPPLESSRLEGCQGQTGDTMRLIHHDPIQLPVFMQHSQFCTEPRGSA